MRKIIVIFILFISLPSFALYQGDYPKYPVKKVNDGKTNFEIGAGVMRSVLYLSRNIKENNDATGYSFMANYGGHKMLRTSVQYTFFKPINIEPTWYNIKAFSLEANLEIIARFKNNKTFLYPFAGLSYNSFTGYFTGVNDFLGLREIYQINSTVTSAWFGVNVGTGIEHAFGPVVLFFDYRMRVGKSEFTEQAFKGINIMDVCYGGGLRYKIPAMTLKKLFRGIGDKYHWF
jgi:hypothetical protein